MWDQPEFDDAADDWEPLRPRRARPIRILAILVVAAMVLALVIPALLRSLQDNEPDEPRPDGVQAAVVVEVTERLVMSDVPIDESPGRLPRILDDRAVPL